MEEGACIIPDFDDYLPFGWMSLEQRQLGGFKVFLLANLCALENPALILEKLRIFCFAELTKLRGFACAHGPLAHPFSSPSIEPKFSSSSSNIFVGICAKDARFFTWN